MKPSDSFWQSLREEQDAALKKASLIPVIRDQMPLRARPTRSYRVVALSAAAALALAAGIVVVATALRLRGSALSFAVGETRQPGSVGAWIAAPDGRSLPLQFSDGSLVALDPGSRARVADVDTAGAHIVLEQGRAVASVVHRDKTRWRVDVGPFLVTVVGTRFAVSWDPAAEVLRLHLQEGQVVVSGSCLSNPKRVSQGQTLRAFCKEGRSELVEQTLAETQPDVSPPAAANTPEAAPVESADSDETSRPGRSAEPATRRAKWQELASAGKFREALELVERTGFDAECARASGQELLTLGDAARLSGNAVRARQSYLLARSKLPGADRAAYGLGLTAFDQQRDFTEAARWFEVYLREQRRGPLRREAMGRLMEAWQRAGDQDKASKIAEQYLVEYPTGAHAALARQLTLR